MREDQKSPAGRRVAEPFGKLLRTAKIISSTIGKRKVEETKSGKGSKAGLNKKSKGVSGYKSKKT